MQFEDLQKVWDQQNQIPMYVLNETALQEQIRRKGRKLNRKMSINEIGMLLICAFTAGNLLLTSENRLYASLIAVAMTVTSIYVLWSRRRRQKMQRTTGSIMEELEQTIKNSDYYIHFAQTFVFWFMLPVVGIVLYRLISAEANWLRWLATVAGFGLAFVVVRLELRYVHYPRKRSLEELKGKLLEEPRVD